MKHFFPAYEHSVQDIGGDSPLSPVWTRGQEILRILNIQKTFQPQLVTHFARIFYFAFPKNP